ncbi:MAG: PEP-CTERM sorting domain-containing protein [Verrucomicrobiota bacterium]
MMTLLPEVSRAAISYSTLGSLYSENFNSLPVNAPSNGNVQTSAYTNGWQDDSGTVAGDHFGVPGWYLYHPIAVAAEGGTSQHQRVRFGPGANTGSFWVFSSTAADTEKALGNVGSLTVAGDNANLYTALRLTNNTGVPLTSFTLTFDGEQWRDGQLATGETLNFGYSTTATASDWFDAGAFISVPTLSFTAPAASGTGTTGTAINGNVAGLVSDITGTVSGIDWQPGTDLWLRWADAQLAGNADDGLAIDNVRFTAVPEPSALLLLAGAAAGLLSRRRVRVPAI